MNKKMKSGVIGILFLIVMMPIAVALDFSDVKVKDASTDFAVIAWETNEAATSEVLYGIDKASLSLKESDLVQTTSHEIFIGNLNPNQIYYYSVKSGNEVSDNGGEYYAFQTLAADTTEPYIETNIAPFSKDSRIDIFGKTEPMTRVNLFVNGVQLRFSSPDEEGEFNFPNVELSLLQANTIKLEAIDSSGNTAEKIFSVIVDSVQPKISLNKISKVATIETIKLEGSISEEAYLEIFVNEELILGENLSIFSKSVSLKEGKNEIRLRAIDRAGNVDIVEKTVVIDTEPPTIEDLDPESGAFFYEGTASTDIKGKTEPGAEVELYVDKDVDGEPHYKTKANSEGRFEFEEVDLDGPFLTYLGGVTGKAEPGYIPVGSEEAEEASRSVLEDNKQGDLKQEERTIKLTFVAEDSVGQKTEEEVSYTIGTCFSGGINWGITNIVEYQAPNLLSPERLSEGTEIITFILNMSYRGRGAEPKIKNVRFEKACRATSIATDKKYNISCKILPNRPVILQSNEEKTLWYIRYNLDKYEGLDELFLEDLEDLANELIFPLKLTVEYTHEINNNVTTDFQTACTKVSYNVDTSKIDPRDVLPDWILEDGYNLINNSINDLNKLIKKVETVRKFTAIACLVGMGLKTITTIIRRLQSWTDYIQDKVPGTDDTTKCPKPADKAKEPLLPGAELKDGTTQADLTNSDLANRCPLAFNAWKLEANARTAFRWACDRYLCHTTPAAWTASEDIEMVRTRIEAGWLCNENEGTQGTILRKPKEDDCEARTGDVKCWAYKDGYYVFKERRDDNVILELKDKRTSYISFGTKKELIVTERSGSMFLPPEDLTCNDACTKLHHYEKGECYSALDANKFTDKESKLYRADARTDVLNSDCKDPKATCVCIGEAKTKGLDNIPKDTLKDVSVTEGIINLKEATDEELKWDYRYDKVGYGYEEYKYYKDRDQSACFGLNNLIDPNDPYLNPRDIVPAFQCVCVSQIYNRLVWLRNILLGLRNCINEIRIKGTADAGVCKEMFSQYICKWLYRVLSKVMKGCTTWSGSGQQTEVGDYFKAGADSIFGGVQEATTDIVSEYDSAALQNYIGVGEGAITNKVCLGALTGDWSWDLEGFLDVGYEQPFHTSALAFPADREYLTFNPQNELGTYEYRVGWMITPGCEIESYTVSLACVSDNEFHSFDGIACQKLAKKPESKDDVPPLGCDCLSSSQGALGKIKSEQTHIIYTGGALPQGAFQDGSKHAVVESAQRYDSVKITMYPSNQEDVSRCFPEKNRMGSAGVFYSSLSDATTFDIAACSWDLVSGEFKCNQGGLIWEQKGSAYFQDIKCKDNGQLVECEDKVFYKGEMLQIDYAPVLVQGQKHCLSIQLTNGHGTELFPEKFLEYTPDPTNEKKWQSTEPNAILLKTVLKEDFGKTAPIFIVNPAGWVPIRTRISENVVYNTFSVYFKDINSKKEGQFSLNLQDWQPFTPTSQISIGGMTFKVNEPIVTPQSKCGIVENCKQYDLKILSSSIAATDAPWNLKLELRHFPEGRASCYDSTTQDVVSHQGIAQKKDIKLRVRPITKKESNACLYPGTYDNKQTQNQKCDCNVDGKIDGSDCDGVDTFYCYGGTKREEASCKKDPMCLVSQPNPVACDCNLNNKLEADECKDKYCVDKKCVDTLPDKKANISDVKYQEGTQSVTPIVLDSTKTLPAGTLIKIRFIARDDKEIKNAKVTIGESELLWGTKPIGSIGGQFITTDYTIRAGTFKSTIIVTDSKDQKTEFRFTLIGT